MLLFQLAAQSTSFAGSATWKTSPATGDWNTASNWTPSTIPNGSSDTATFASSNTTAVSLSAATEVNGIGFNASASAFTISAPTSSTSLTISGVGITNNSGISQNFVASRGTNRFDEAAVKFTDSATAGNQTVFTATGGVSEAGFEFGGRIYFLNDSIAGTGTFLINGSTEPNAYNGLVQFFDTASAANGIFINKGGTVSGEFGGGLTSFSGNSTAASGTFINNGGAANRTVGGTTIFSDNATAANGTFTTNGSAPGALRAIMDFRLNSTAANGTFITNGGTVDGGVSGLTTFGSNSSAANGNFINNGGEVSGAAGADVTFFNASTAANSTLIANGGIGGGSGASIFFIGGSTGGLARIKLFGNGNLDFSAHSDPGTTVGSIEGDGVVFLGSINLKVGSNNRSTEFFGVITDGGSNFFNTGGSLTKIGAGELVLRHRSTYPGGTKINRSKLIVNNDGGSGTGSGPVQVNHGTLGGRGEIDGAVTVGRGSGSGAFLSPGYKKINPGTLTIHSTLTFNSDATYKVQLNSTTVQADKLVAAGVTINSGAQFSFTDLGNGTLALGTVFRVINNTGATPIAGTFSNLADGATFTNNGNSYQVDYQGGTGNDLTLTVQ